MASGPYTTGVMEIHNKTITWVGAGAGSIKIALLSTATAYTYDPDHLVADTGGANDVIDAETNVAGYVRGWGGAGRKALLNRTMAKDDANNRYIFDADDVAAWTLAAGETVAAAVILEERATNDTNTRLIFYIDFTDTLTNGGTFTVAFDAVGICTVTMA